MDSTKIKLCTNRKSFIKLAPGNVLWQELYLSVFSSLAAV